MEIGFSYTPIVYNIYKNIIFFKLPVAFLLNKKLKLEVRCLKKVFVAPRGVGLGSNFLGPTQLQMSAKKVNYICQRGIPLALTLSLPLSLCLSLQGRVMVGVRVCMLPPHVFHQHGIMCMRVYGCVSYFFLHK